MVFIGICIMGIAVTGFIRKSILLIYLGVLMLLLAHGWRNNAMMTYVEKNAYDGTGNKTATP